jgi:hypothetical protein
MINYVFHDEITGSKSASSPAQFGQPLARLRQRWGNNW